MSLYTKLHQIMVESEAIEKSMTVGDGGKNSYKAVSEAAVLNAIKPLLKKHKLILFPVKIEVKDSVDIFPTKYGESSRLMTQVKATYKIVDIESGEFELLESIGNGVDTQDKGSGKAMTYAYKALIQKTFCLFSGEDTDNEHSDIITERQAQGKPQQSEMPQQWKQQTQELEHAGLISTNQAKRLFAIAKGNQDAIKKVISKYGYTGTKDITIKDYNNICKEIEMEAL